MRPLSNPRHLRWSTWAGDGDFRRRAESALTHPATVAALGVLLLNDLLFKALWPQAWLTGKLSDLAWLVFALPLLAFLLSFAARGNLRAQRVAFLAAYAGLPILYAAFNTFDPVHDWIMRGISLAGGAAGSPRDATDSLVIPLAWGAALWVWRREAPATGTMRLRWAVLVAGVAALASVASSYPEAAYGVQDVGISVDGEIVANASRMTDFGTHSSVDGGMTWSQGKGYQWNTAWSGGNVDTPRGRYAIVGLDVIRVGTDGSSEDVVHSMRYLEGDGNVWVQKVSTERLDQPRKIASRPLGIVYDEATGNLVVALGIQGVVVGTPDGRWTNVAVGRFEPTDFSFIEKTQLLLSDMEFWIAALAVCVSMTAFGLTASRFRFGDFLRTIVVLTATTLAVVGLVVGLAAGLMIVFPSQSGNLFIGVYWPLMVYVVPWAVVGVVLFALIAPRRSRSGRWVTTSLVLLAMLASGALMFIFGFSDDVPGSGLFNLLFFLVAIAAWLLGISSLAASLRHMVRRWRLVALSLAGMVALVFLTFMLWLHLDLNLVVTKAASIALCGVAAVVLAGYAARTASAQVATCANCGRHAAAHDAYCINCGAQLAEG